MTMNTASRDTQQRGDLIWVVLAVIAVLVGIWLRTYQLGTQLLIDDEWHALHRMLHADVIGILTHFGVADYSIPLTLYDRSLMALGVLSEFSMRLPMLLAGVALLMLVLPLLRNWTSLPVRVVLTGLLAVSPVHVYLSRTARPYALVSLLSFVALMSFPRWWQRQAHSTRWGVLYVALTVLGAWLHVLSLVFTLMPFAYYGCFALRDMLVPARRAGALNDLGRLLRLGLPCALLLALLLLPPLLGDWDALATKAGAGKIDANSLWRSLLMMFGTGASWIGALLSALAAFGIWQIWQRDRTRAAYVLSAMVAGLLAIVLARPLWIQHQGVLVRYALPMLPFLLWFVAEGIRAITHRLTRTRPWLQAVTVTVLIGGLFFSGPIPQLWYQPNQFMGHPYFQFDYSPKHNPYFDPALLPELPMPPFLRKLAQRPPASVTLVITPWIGRSTEMPGPWYQPVHRQLIKGGMLSGLCDVRPWSDFPESVHGIHLRNAVHVSALLRGDVGDADYLVVRLQMWTLAQSAGDRVPWPDMTKCLPKIRSKLAEPVYRDEQIVVFALTHEMP